MSSKQSLATVMLLEFLVQRKKDFVESVQTEHFANIVEGTDQVMDANHASNCEIIRGVFIYQNTV